jgi:tight adherence protein B
MSSVGPPVIALGATTVESASATWSAGAGPVGVSEITLIAFAAIGLGVFAVGLVVRDLVWSARGANGTVTTGRLRRIPDVFDQPTAPGFFGQIDQGFDRLVLESGTELHPATTFLMMLSGALLVGGCCWLYSGEPLHGIAGGLAGLAVPLVWLVIIRGRRMRAIREQLPHVLDMLARATRAGQSVEQAFTLIGQEAGGVLGPEFRKCEQQLQMGRSFEKVLKSLASRVRLVELRIFTTTLIVQQRSGGPLSETLERMSGVVRDRLTAQRQISASTGAGRMSTLTVAAVAPLAYMVVFIFHRSHLDILFEDPFGRMLLVIAMVLEVVGLIWVFTLLKREE